MRGRIGLALLALLPLAGCGGRGGADLGRHAVIECAPYAREVSGLALYGEAAGWWREAAGRYRRADRPVPGAVLVFHRSARLPQGHVAVVARVVSRREILVDQANWVHHRIGRDDPVIDVSPGNDWTRVRVWWAPAGRIGEGVYRTDGFILPPVLAAR